MEEIGIAEVLLACAEYLRDPQNEQGNKNFDKMRQRISIKKYLPLEQKKIVVAKAIYDLRIEDLSAAELAVALEESLIFNVLLAYTNINPEIPITFKSEIYYDILLECGMIEHILHYCEIDYKRTEYLVKQAMSFENIKALLEQVGAMDSESMDRLTSEFKRFTLETKPETLQNLADIMRHNDPMFTAMKQGMVDAAYEGVMKAQKEQNNSDKEE